MKFKKEQYLIMTLYVCLCQFSFSASVQILQNGENKVNPNGPILLKHDVTKAMEEGMKNLEKEKQLVQEGKIEEDKANKTPFLHLHSSPEALAQTGILVNFETKEDDQNLSLKDKEIHIEDGVFSVEGNAWGYPSSKGRKFTVENSKIFIDNSAMMKAINSQKWPIYVYANDRNRYNSYYKFQVNGLQKKNSDIETERKHYKESRNIIKGLRVENALLDLKNSEFQGDILLSYKINPNPREKDLNLYPISSGLHVRRTGAKLEDGKYDLLSEYIKISGRDLLGMNVYDKKSILSWYQNRFHKEKGTPIFLLGENTKMKGKVFDVNLRYNLTSLIYEQNIPEIKGITHDAKEDEMIVFQKNSEANFESMQIDSANVKFQGGKINMIQPSNQGATFAFAHSQLMGNAVFQIKGDSILRGAVAYIGDIDKNIFFTNLDFLPGSKIDVNFIKDSARDLFAGYIAMEHIKDDALKGGEFKFTLEDNTKIYLGYSKRQLEKKIEAEVEEAQEVLNRLENIPAEVWEGLPESYREKIPKVIQEHKNKIKRVQTTNFYYASDADMHFKKNSNLYLFREEFTDKALMKNGEVNPEIDEQGNLSEFSGRLTFDHANLHLRTNLKDEISDRLIAINYPIIGEGATLYLKNKGSIDMTGKENIVLISAAKGSGSKTKFQLDGGKVSLGGFDYKLHERLTEKGKEYYLAHGVVEGVRPEKVKAKTFTSDIPNLSAFSSVDSLSLKQDIKNKQVKVETKKDEDVITWDKDISIENSTVAALGGKGILSNNAKLSLKNSALYSAQGLALDGVEKKELLVLDKNSSIVLENANGGAALALKDATVKFDGVKKASFQGSYVIYSNGGKISGKGLFNIDGNIYHKGEGGINLQFEKGSRINTSIIDIAGNSETSRLLLKDGSKMYINNYSNANMVFEKGSQLHLYSKEQAGEKLDVLNRGNRVIFTEPMNFESTDIYFRTNIDKEESDRLELLSTLTGTGANLHLNNHADTDMPSGGKEAELVIAKTPKNFTWNLANPLEVGGYVYDAQLKKRSNGLGSDIISVVVGPSGERKATLSSTAQGMLESTKTDYTTYNSIQDSLFDSLYHNVPTERKNSIWAKNASDTFKTKEYGMESKLNTILVGFDRILDQKQNITSGVFVGHYKNDKKLKEHSGKGSLDGFIAGAYLSYRGYLGFGDFTISYATGQSKYDVLDTTSMSVSNKQDSKYLGAGVRFGRKFFMDAKEHFYFEPSAKITYGRLEGQTSKASNGLGTRVDAVKSWTTGASMKLGYQNDFAFGSLNSYTKLGVSQEILGKYKVQFNDNGVKDVKLDHNTMNYGVGMEYKLGNNTLSLDVDMKNNPAFKNYYKFSLGYQYKF